MTVAKKGGPLLWKATGRMTAQYQDGYFCGFENGIRYKNREVYKIVKLLSLRYLQSTTI